MASQKDKLERGILDILIERFDGTGIFAARDSIMRLIEQYTTIKPQPSVPTKKPKPKPLSRRSSYFACVDSAQKRSATSRSRSSSATSGSKVAKELLNLLDTKEFCSSGPKDRKRRCVKVDRFDDTVFDKPKKHRRVPIAEWRVAHKRNKDDEPLSMRLARRKSHTREAKQANGASRRPTSTVTAKSGAFLVDGDFFGPYLDDICESPVSHSPLYNPMSSDDDEHDGRADERRSDASKSIVSISTDCSSPARSAPSCGGWRVPSTIPRRRASSIGDKDEPDTVLISDPSDDEGAAPSDYRSRFAQFAHAVKTELLADSSDDDTNTLVLDVPDLGQEVIIADGAEDLQPTFSELDSEVGAFLEAVNDNCQQPESSAFTMDHDYTQFESMDELPSTLDSVDRVTSPVKGADTSTASAGGQYSGLLSFNRIFDCLENDVY